MNSLQHKIQISHKLKKKTIYFPSISISLQITLCRTGFLNNLNRIHFVLSNKFRIRRTIKLKIIYSLFSIYSLHHKNKISQRLKTIYFPSISLKITLSLRFNKYILSEHHKNQISHKFKIMYFLLISITLQFTSSTGFLDEKNEFASFWQTYFEFAAS